MNVKKKETYLRVVKVVEEMCEIDIHEDDNLINHDRTRKTRLDLNSMVVSYSCKTKKREFVFFVVYESVAIMFLSKKINEEKKGLKLDDRRLEK